MICPSRSSMRENGERRSSVAKSYEQRSSTMKVCCRDESASAKKHRTTFGCSIERMISISVSRRRRAFWLRPLVSTTLTATGWSERVCSPSYTTANAPRPSSLRS